MGDAGLNPAIGTQKYISPLNTAVLYSSLPTAYSAYPINSSYILGCNLRPNRKYSSIAFPYMNSYGCIYIFGLFLIISRTSFIRPFTMSISRAFLINLLFTPKWFILSICRNTDFMYRYRG